MLQDSSLLIAAQGHAISIRDTRFKQHGDRIGYGGHCRPLPAVQPLAYVAEEL